MQNRGLESLLPYQVSAGATLPKDGLLRLDWNEAQVPPSPMVLAAIRDGLDNLNFYPDVEATDLRAALAGYVKLPAECIRAYNGSDAALRDVCAAFLSPGDRVSVKRPVYTQIDTFLAVQDAVAANWTTDPVWGHDPQAQADELEAHEAAMCYVVNPNNPTGELYTAGGIAMLAVRFPEVLFLVDEAYIEFGGFSAADVARARPNVLITRTFSKAFGLAGLRLGYVLGHPETLAVLDKVRNGKEVNALAQRAGIAALADLDYMRTYVEAVWDGMTWTAEQARAMGYTVRTTAANFLLLKANEGIGGRGAPELVGALRERGILVRDRSSLPGMAGWVRVTVGTMAHMKQFVADLENVTEGR